MNAIARKGVKPAYVRRAARELSRSMKKVSIKSVAKGKKKTVSSSRCTTAAQKRRTVLSSSSSSSSSLPRTEVQLVEQLPEPEASENVNHDVEASRPTIETAETEQVNEKNEERESDRKISTEGKAQETSSAENKQSSGQEEAPTNQGEGKETGKDKGKPKKSKEKPRVEYSSEEVEEELLEVVHHLVDHGLKQAKHLRRLAQRTGHEHM